MRNSNRLVLFTVFLIALTVSSKLLFGSNLDFSGFSPVLAIALFSGMIMGDKKFTFLMPLLALFLSDVVIEVLYQNRLFDYGGFYKGMWLNYALLLSVTALGWLLKGKNWTRIVLSAFLAPTLYFLLSNGLVWYSSTEQVYARSISGLMTCYEAGLPFYRNSLIGMIVFLPAITFVWSRLGGKRVLVAQ